MGMIKPIGSEKLQGMDKIRRIMEIANYNHALPNKDIELKSTEYRLTLSDGNSYEIVKERQGYIIKRNITESYSDYIEPMKNRRYYNSYSQALKKLNLMAKEFNTLYGNDLGTNLFTEQKKFKLKVPKPKAEVEPTEAPTLPEPSPEAGAQPGMGGDAGMGAQPGMGGDTGMGGQPGMGGDAGMGAQPGMGGDTGMGAEPGMGGQPGMGGDAGMGAEPGMGGQPGMGGDAGMGDEEGMEAEPGMGDEKEGGVSFKLIQKLTGKLTQKIRKYLNDEEMDSDDTKYIINSVLSSLDLTALDEEDVEEIIDRLEGGDEEEDEDGEDMGDMEDTEMDTEEPAPEMEPEAPEAPSPEGEMTEYGYRNRNRMRIGPMGKSHDMFSESKVDKIISGYFKLSDNEKRNYRTKKNLMEQRISDNVRINEMEIKRLSFTTPQENAALKFLKQNPNAILIGTTNKNNLLFKVGLNEHKITMNGRQIL